MTRDPGKLRKRRWLLLVLVSVLLAGGFWWLLRSGGLPVLPSSDVIWRLGWGPVVVYSLLWQLTLFFKALRWYFQLAPLASVPISRVFSASWVGYSAQLLIPLKAGEFVRPALISRGTPITFFAAVSTSATERIVDAIFGSTILIVCLLNAQVLDPLPERIGDLPVPAKVVPTLGYGFAALALVAVLVVVIFYIKREASKRLIQLTLGKISPKASAVVQEKLGELADGLTLVSSPKHGLRYALMTAMYWGSYMLGIWYVVRASGFSELSLAQAGVVTGTLAFSFSMPNAPGYFGIFQVSIYAALAVFYPASAVQDLGATAVFWLYVLQLGWSLSMAPIGAWMEHRAIRRAQA